jgi:hypothetical protein
MYINSSFYAVEKFYIEAFESAFMDIQIPGMDCLYYPYQMERTWNGITSYYWIEREYIPIIKWKLL